MRKNSSLLAYFETKLNSALRLLQLLVEMESHSQDKQGVDALAGFLAREFDSRSARPQLILSSLRGNLLRAVWVSGLDSSPVMLLGHMDTVWPRGTLASRPFRVEGGRAFGPGVFDMKSGILLCLLICEAFRDGAVNPGKDVIFFFTGDEEIGTECGLPHLRREAARCRAVLCLEPSLPGGKVKTSRKGVGQFRVQVKGIPAHAGVDHEKGANAILELSRQVLALQGLTDYERGITVNVGEIRGGSASNVVAAEAVAEVDFRVGTVSDGRWVEERIRGLKPYDTRCELVIEGGMNRPPLERTPAVVDLYRKARTVASDFGMDLGEGSTGGGSDGSFTAALGIPTLDGLGVEGDGAHALHEQILIEDIPRRAALLSRLVSDL